MKRHDGGPQPQESGGLRRPPRSSPEPRSRPEGQADDPEARKKQRAKEPSDVPPALASISFSRLRRVRRVSPWRYSTSLSSISLTSSLCARETTGGARLGGLPAAAAGNPSHSLPPGDPSLGGRSSCLRHRKRRLQRRGAAAAVHGTGKRRKELAPPRHPHVPSSSSPSSSSLKKEPKT